MMPKLEVRRLRRITWSMVSKTALRSRERSRVASPLSDAWYIESRRWIREVSVEWCLRYADWRGLKLGERAISNMWLLTCKKKPFENFGDIIEVRARSKISRDRWIQAWLFRSWVTKAWLNLDGKVPWLQEKLAMYAMRSENTGEYWPLMLWKLVKHRILMEV